MDKGKLYVVIVLFIWLIVAIITIPALISNGNYSGIISPLIPFVFVVMYYIYKWVRKDNDDEK